MIEETKNRYSNPKTKQDIPVSFCPLSRTSEASSSVFSPLNGQF
ncbi:hypothetical protein LEP1GSC016_1371 [Leptospira borgpetersenii serovar Hardjo-bovis str. Sponselee]|uniref:Uncharacterized protein n=1 Tax=Leptospira borgpetersenii serovar Hardjo-bovis str. Sponselee TaxID=1303729 RepID=M6BY46_LEPBO|nr:hypothetical protein LEP1GSC016_1371 [Leptospira borgpetersenii serovar Hardjo-bovis str. Sponselee]